jgi:hypothetical protein
MVDLASSSSSNQPALTDSPHPDDAENDATWTAGDFEIISADGVRFKVEGYHLYSCR